MHPVRRKRLVALFSILIILGLAVGLILYALQQNINLFYGPTQVAQGEAPQNITIRVGGMVVENSVQRDQTSLAVRFEVTDFVHNIAIEYDGILPDLFREGQGIVAQGKLNENGIFIAQEVLAKHDEKYMSPEVSEALESAKSYSTTLVE
ncbi:cytochrome c maturation protein CcmE [Marinomonas agarivorans]|nr:cytochrome c maturation protein CcmE [Marinomonas agarivorans]